MFKGYTIITDMDGTLLNSKGILTQENIEAINEFVEKGGNFTVATGRMLPSVEKFIDKLNLTMPAILYNGSKLYNFNNKEIIYEKYLEDEKRNIIKKIAKETENIGIEIYIDETVYVYKPCRYTERLSIKNLDVRFTFEEERLFENKWKKILLLGEVEDMNILEDTYVNVYKAGKITRSGDKFLEILPSDTSKGQAVEFLCNAYALDKEKLYTLGDAMNDVELLNVGTHGYCVANAAKRVKQIAKTLEVSNDDHIIKFIVEKIKQEKIKMN
ncbi:MAG: Cof-type HAD-IIB family hydrolase [Sarcina sp.]